MEYAAGNADMRRVDGDAAKTKQVVP